MGVIGANGGDLPQGVGDDGDIPSLPRVRVAVRMIGVGGDIRDIGSRTIHRQHPAVGVVGVAPSPSRTRARSTKALAAIHIACRLLDSLAQDPDGLSTGSRGYHSVGWGAGRGRILTVIDPSCELERAGQLNRQSPVTVPLRVDSPRIRATHPFYALDLEVPREIEGVVRLSTIEVQVAR